MLAPPDKYYRVEGVGAWWQFWREEDSLVSSVGKGRLAKDHPMQPTGNGEYELTVTKVAPQEGGGYEEGSPAWEGDLQAILYIEGEVATCDGARSAPLELAWHEGDGTDELAMRALCGRYIWTRFVPDLLTIVTLITVVVLLLAFVAGRAKQAEEERRHLKAEKRREEEEQTRQMEVDKRQRIESLLRRGAVQDKINYMSGVEFERFMADLLRQKGYAVQETRATGDQGVDLLLDLDDKRVAVQLKRWTGPVGNAVVAATFAGMAHYQAEEGWIITTSTFTKPARELAKSTRVRLIDGKELAEWLEGLSEQK